MVVRRAEERDIPAILELLKQVNKLHANARPDLFRPQTKYSGGQLEAIISAGERPIFVADDGSGAVGYAMCEFIDSSVNANLMPIKTLYIDDLCVDEGVRGRGIGTLLFEYVKQYAKQSGCHNVTLHVWACNPAAEAFYKKCGMKPQQTTMEIIF